MIKNSHLCLCSDADMARVLPFGKENIVRRYKSVPSKTALYNGMQIVAYMIINNLSEHDLSIALESINRFKDDDKALLDSISERMTK